MNQTVTIITNSEYNFDVLSFCNVIGMISMILFSLYFYFQSHKGFGRKHIPYNDMISRNEVSDISAIVTMTTACFYAIKLCYDLTNEISFKSVDYWTNEMK